MFGVSIVASSSGLASRESRAITASPLNGVGNPLSDASLNLVPIAALAASVVTQRGDGADIGCHDKTHDILKDYAIGPCGVSVTVEEW